jgi:hypothetical protein
MSHTTRAIAALASRPLGPSRRLKVTVPERRSDYTPHAGTKNVAVTIVTCQTRARAVLSNGSPIAATVVKMRPMRWPRQKQGLQEAHFLGSVLPMRAAKGLTEINRIVVNAFAISIFFSPRWCRVADCHVPRSPPATGEWWPRCCLPQPTFPLTFTGVCPEFRRIYGQRDRRCPPSGRGTRTKLRKPRVSGVECGCGGAQRQ